MLLRVSPRGGRFVTQVRVSAGLRRGAGRVARRNVVSDGARAGAGSGAGAGAGIKADATEGDGVSGNTPPGRTFSGRGSPGQKPPGEVYGIRRFLPGLFSVTIFEVGNIYHGIQTPR